MSIMATKNENPAPFMAVLASRLPHQLIAYQFFQIRIFKDYFHLNVANITNNFQIWEYFIK